MRFRKRISNVVFYVVLFGILCLMIYAKPSSANSSNSFDVSSCKSIDCIDNALKNVKLIKRNLKPCEKIQSDLETKNGLSYKHYCLQKANLNYAQNSSHFKCLKKHKDFESKYFPEDAYIHQSYLFLTNEFPSDVSLSFSNRTTNGGATGSHSNMTYVNQGKHRYLLDFYFCADNNKIQHLYFFRSVLMSGKDSSTTIKAFSKPPFRKSALGQFQPHQWKSQRRPKTSFAFDLNQDKFNDLLLVETMGEDGSPIHTNAKLTACLYKKDKKLCKLSTVKFEGTRRTALLHWSGKVDRAGLISLSASDLSGEAVTRYFRIENDKIISQRSPNASVSHQKQDLTKNFFFEIKHNCKVEVYINKIQAYGLKPDGRVKNSRYLSQYIKNGNNTIEYIFDKSCKGQSFKSKLIEEIDDEEKTEKILVSVDIDKIKKNIYSKSFKIVGFRTPIWMKGQKVILNKDTKHAIYKEIKKYFGFMHRRQYENMVGFLKSHCDEIKAVYGNKSCQKEKMVQVNKMMFGEKKLKMNFPKFSDLVFDAIGPNKNLIHPHIKSHGYLFKFKINKTDSTLGSFAFSKIDGKWVATMRPAITD